MDYKMLCGSAEAESRRYHLYNGVWLVADQENAADNIYLAGNGRGFGGRKITFTLVSGDKITFQGPWLSNANHLFLETGIDVRDKYKTLGAIAKDLDGDALEDIVYQDKQPMIGSFNRIPDAAQLLANQLKIKLYYHVESSIGSRTSWVNHE